VSAFGRHGRRGRSVRGYRYGDFFSARLRRPMEEQRSLYRDRNGVLLGVCAGLARYFDLPVNMVRAAVLLLFFVTGIWPVGFLYLIAAMIMKVAPLVPFGTPEDREFYDSYSSSRTGALQRLKRKFENLDRRIQRMEDVVTSRDFEWERRMRE